MSATRTTAAGALGLLGVVLLDGLGDPLVQAPAAGQDAADQRVVDAQLAALGVDAVVRGAAAAVEALGVARVQAGEDRAPDVVEDRGQGELVAVAVPDHLGHAVGGVLDGEGVEPEGIGREGEVAVPVEEVVGGGRAHDGLDGAGSEALDGVGDAADAPAGGQLAGGADDGAGQADVGLDDARDLVGRGAAGDELQRLVARLLERGLALSLVERGCEDASTALAARGRLGRASA